MSLSTVEDFKFLSVMGATDMSSTTYSKAYIYDGSFIPLKVDTSRIRCKMKVLREGINKPYYGFRSNCECAGMCSAMQKRDPDNHS